MRSRVIAALIVLAGLAFAQASRVPGLLKPEVEQEMDRLKDSKDPADQQKLAEITSVQSGFMEWRASADRDPAAARTAWKELGERGQRREEERFRRIIIADRVKDLVDELSSVAAEGDDQGGSWLGDLLDLLNKKSPKKPA
ncbi:MAG: hypothetical protein HY925_13315 [Elusimicrobia bacterium]|nr:hypothetical protein [Elusimicrobiota bacterium]